MSDDGNKTNDLKYSSRARKNISSTPVKNDEIILGGRTPV